MTKLPFNNKIAAIAFNLQASYSEIEQQTIDFVESCGGTYSQLMPQIASFVRDFGYFPKNMEELRMKPVVEIMVRRQKSGFPSVHELRKSLDISLIDGRI